MAPALISRVELVNTHDIHALVAAVPDPEIPTLTIGELGILRRVSVQGSKVTVDITPTYSGCPAMGVIREDIETALGQAGVAEVEVRTVLSPAWTTDWIGEDARHKLIETGIAPPGPDVRCPRCEAGASRTISRFGSTACKALMVCSSCREPFDHFKPL